MKCCHFVISHMKQIDRRQLHSVTCTVTFIHSQLCFHRDLLRVGVTLAGHQKKILSSIQTLRIHKAPPTLLYWPITALLCGTVSGWHWARLPLFTDHRMLQTCHFDQSEGSGETTPPDGRTNQKHQVNCDISSYCRTSSVIFITFDSGATELRPPC